MQVAKRVATLVVNRAMVREFAREGGSRIQRASHDQYESSLPRELAKPETGDCGRRQKHMVPVASCDAADCRYGQFRKARDLHHGRDSRKIKGALDPERESSAP